MRFFKAMELKKRIWFTLFVLVVYWLGTYIPVPGIDAIILFEFFHLQGDSMPDFLGIFDIFTGGALQRMSIFALGLMPYISATIIMLLVTAVSPYFQQLKKEGESGRKKINQYTALARYCWPRSRAMDLPSGSRACRARADPLLWTLVCYSV
jgi:preprotein translocase subunit SecY